MYIKINAHTCMNIFKKNMLRLYIKCLYMTNYMNINIYINIFKIYAICVCIYLYIINIHNTHTGILCKQKLLFWM